MSLQEGKKKISNAFIEYSINGHKVITCRQLLNQNLPAFLVENILTFARKTLKKEKPVTWNFNANLDFDNKEVKVSFEKFMLALIKSVRFNKSEIENCVRNAVHQRFDLLVNPRQTIESVYFRESKDLDFDLFRRSLNKIGSGVPIIDNLLQRIEEQNLKTLNRFTFNMLVREIQKDIYENNTYTEIINEFNLLLDLYKIDQVLYAKGIESIIVEHFMVSRELTEALGVIRKKTEQGKSHWLSEDVQDLFKFVLSTPHKEKQDHSDSEEILGLPKVIFPDDDGIFKIKKKKIEKQPPGPYPQLRHLMEKKDYKLFLRKLFNNDESALTHFIEQLDSLDKWRKAKHIIDWELEKRNVDPYCKEALRLGDIVFAKYFSKGKYT